MINIMKTSFKKDQTKESLYQESVLKELLKLGPIGMATEKFMRQRKVGLKFRNQKNSGASWTLAGNIHLNANHFSLDSKPENPGMLSLVVHEAHHLKQGLLIALSVYGELDAWQVGFNFYKEVTGSQLNPILVELMELPLGFSRPVLKQAADLMKAYSPGYRSDLLPLYPIHRELVWWLTRKEPVDP